jgi:hypothetical protein
MTDAVFDFKSINRKLNRQEQKAEFEAKNPKVEPSMYGWPYGVAVPYCETAIVRRFDPPLTSLAHPEWPYTGTPHEWPKFKI